MPEKIISFDYKVLPFKSRKLGPYNYKSYVKNECKKLGMMEFGNFIIDLTKSQTGRLGAVRTLNKHSLNILCKKFPFIKYILPYSNYYSNIFPANEINSGDFFWRVIELYKN